MTLTLAAVAGICFQRTYMCAGETHAERKQNLQTGHPKSLARLSGHCLCVLA